MVFQAKTQANKFLLSCLPRAPLRGLLEHVLPRRRLVQGVHGRPRHVQPPPQERHVDPAVVLRPEGRVHHHRVERLAQPGTLRGKALCGDNSMG